MAVSTSKLTLKQSTRLAECELSDSVKVVGWNAELRGPVIYLSDKGVSYVVTRDGGLYRLP